MRQTDEEKEGKTTWWADMVVLRRLLVLLSSFTLLSLSLIPPSELPSSHLFLASSWFLSVFRKRRNLGSPSLKGIVRLKRKSSMLIDKDYLLTNNTTLDIRQSQIMCAGDTLILTSLV